MELEHLGKRIRDQRESLKMTQQQLADRLRVSAQAVSKWERGVSEPELAHFDPLADALGMSIEWLLGLPAVAPSHAIAQLVDQKTVRVTFKGTFPPQTFGTEVWKTEVIDLDGDGVRETVVVGTGRGGTDGGSIFVWSRERGWEPVYRAGTEAGPHYKCSGEFLLNRVSVVDRTADRPARILVVAWHFAWFPTEVVLLTHGERNWETRCYLHPGHVDGVLIDRHEGKEVVFIAGVNNRLAGFYHGAQPDPKECFAYKHNMRMEEPGVNWAPFVCGLEADKLGGKAPSSPGDQHPEGTLFYCIPQVLFRPLAQDATPNVTRTASGVPDAGGEDVYFWTADGRIFTVRTDGTPTDCTLSDPGRNRYRRLWCNEVLQDRRGGLVNLAAKPSPPAAHEKRRGSGP